MSRRIRFQSLDVMNHIGEGYGEAVDNFFKGQVIDPALERIGVGNPVVVITSCCYDDDDCGERLHVEYKTLYECMLDFFDNRWDEDYGFETVESLNTFSEFRGAYSDYFDGDYSRIVYIETEEEQEKREEEQEKREQEELRVDLERDAGIIAREFNVRVDSIEFIRAIYSKLRRVESNREQWNNPETRMEEWAAHQYCGTRDAYFDDLNYVNEQIYSEHHRYHQILGWLSQNCPLLWAKWEEICSTEESEEFEDCEV